MGDKRKKTSAMTLVPNLWRNEEEKKLKISNWKPFLRLNKDLEKFKETEGMGYGIERCLYELNPTLVCLSPYLIHAAALTPAEALIALEGVASQSDRPQYPIDRHLAAFLMSRWKGLSYVDSLDLGKPQREVKSLANLKILAGIQDYFKVAALPNLCQWMAELCAPIVSRYRNLATRNRINKDIAEAVTTGQLTNLAKIFANQQGLEKDEEEFKAARAEIWLIESEIKEIEAKYGTVINLCPIPNQTFGKECLYFYTGLYKQER